MKQISRPELLHKLMIHAINEMLARDLFSLAYSPEQHTDYVNSKCDEKDLPAKEFGHAFIDIQGYPSLVFWRAVGWGELNLTAWFDVNRAELEKYAENVRCFGFHRNKIYAMERSIEKDKMKTLCRAFVSCWFERKNGAYIQCREDGRVGWVSSPYMRADSRYKIAALPEAIPQGYKESGKFMM
ncbi:hypothetical protein OGV38_06955 [Citrobacter sp. Cb080]|uniref:hypothetical protein n=1 Tax=Citrobacter TaxID=544 RepID=UPI0025785C5E|nr:MULTISPECIES: hypothetical protein [Citrobacter]MDM3322861.1 hypothetical protein [Citrobacter sp. Cb080]MDV2015943.1 hypothetical protein [Citrobacter freundii]MEB0317104.1 hypothetical protein [Citrobacter freundii]MEB0383779.1 hypothetical protein [Citrobacter freundii]MEB1038027.1 hypothetical protein [Citrobacter freundii]